MDIQKGEFIVVFGTSGGGKTTLLNIIGTIDKPTKGKLKLCGTCKHQIYFIHFLLIELKIDVSVLCDII